MGGPVQISPGKNTGCPAAPALSTTSASDWILGVAFAGTLTRLKQPAQEFTCVRCCGTPKASSPHDLAAKTRSHQDDPASCSCLQLTVATNSPRKGLSPPIQCPCRAHLRRAPAGAL